MPAPGRVFTNRSDSRQPTADGGGGGDSRFFSLSFPPSSVVKLGERVRLLYLHRVLSYGKEGIFRGPRPSLRLQTADQQPSEVVYFFPMHPRKEGEPIRPNDIVGIAMDPEGIGAPQFLGCNLGRRKLSWYPEISEENLEVWWLVRFEGEALGIGSKFSLAPYLRPTFRVCNPSSTSTDRDLLYAPLTVNFEGSNGFSTCYFSAERYLDHKVGSSDVPSGDGRVALLSHPGTFVKREDSPTSIRTALTSTTSQHIRAPSVSVTTRSPNPEYDF